MFVFRSRIARLALALLVSVLAACYGEDGATGPDGEDGLSSLRFTWAYAPYYIVSEGDLPTTIYVDQYFYHDPGVYDFGYQAWDGSYWTGWYSIQQDLGEPGEPGEKGGMFWKKGADGAPGEHGRDFYLTIGAWSSGPTFSVYWDSWWLSTSPSSIAELKAGEAARRSAPLTLQQEAAVPVNEGHLIEQRIGPWRVAFQFHRVDSLPSHLRNRSVLRSR